MELDSMTWSVVAIAVAVALVVGATALLRTRRERSRSAQLRRAFGPEYDAAVSAMGRKRGEQDLEQRVQRYQGLTFERVNFRTRETLTTRWAECQYRFVEDPTYSLREAQHVISRLMHQRGYPSDLGEAVRALSVSRPCLAHLYREATDAYRRTRDGEGAIEVQYPAIVAYRRVFEALTTTTPRDMATSSALTPVAER